MARAAVAFAPLLLVLLCLQLGNGGAALATLDEPFFQDLCRWAAGARGWEGLESAVPSRRSAAFGTASAGMGGSVSAPRKELRPGAVAGAGLRCVALPWETCPCPLRRASPPSRVLAGGTAAYQ